MGTQRSNETAHGRNSRFSRESLSTFMRHASNMTPQVEFQSLQNGIIAANTMQNRRATFKSRMQL